MPQGEVNALIKLENEERWLELYEAGLSPLEASQELGVSLKYADRRDRRTPSFRARYRRERDKRSGKVSPVEDTFPDFLAFRERHFAYMSLRDKHPRTGRKAIKRARNSWFQVDAAEKLAKQNRCIIVMPPGHIKTTFFGIEMSAWEIFRDRNFRGMVVQKNQAEAAKVVSAVQDRLQCDYYHRFSEMLLEQGEEGLECPVCLYGGPEGFRPKGRIAGDLWGAMGFRVSGRTSGEKDHTFQALGFGSQIQGIRSDRIVIDDLQDPMVAKTSEIDSMNKMEWFRDVILGRVTDTQQVVVLANFFAPDDFAHKLIEAYPDWPQTNYPAVRDWERKQILCPEFWTFEALKAKRKEVGENTWHFTWEQSEGSYDDQVFQRDALERARDDDYVLGTIHPDITHLYIGCDPAISNWCSIIVWGLDQRTGQRFLVEDFNKKGMRAYIPYISDAILDLAAKYHPEAAVIESVSQQKSLHNNPDFRKAMRNLGCRIEPYATATATGARSEAASFDISSVGGLFDQNMVTLPYGGTVEDRKRTDDYITELVNWRPGVRTIRKDRVMATLFAESEAFVQAARTFKKQRQRKPRILPDWVADADGRWAWRRSVSA